MQIPDYDLNIMPWTKIQLLGSTVYLPFLVSFQTGHFMLQQFSQASQLSVIFYSIKILNLSLSYSLSYPVLFPSNQKI